MDSQQVSDWIWLIVIGSYIIVSTFFLWFPNIIHKRRAYSHKDFEKISSSNKRFCVGHRGAAYEKPENTMEGFEYAAKFCDILQIDICGTEDGQLVCFHDQNLLRVTGKDLIISEMPSDKLPLFEERYQKQYNDEFITSSKNQIPTLQEIFKAFPDTPMMLELKTPELRQLEYDDKKDKDDKKQKKKQKKKIQGYDWPIQELNRLVRKYEREDYTIWGSEKEQFMVKLHEINPKVMTFYSFNEVVWIVILFVFGLLPFACLRQGCLVVPYLSNVFNKQLDEKTGFKRFKKKLTHSFFNFIAIFFLRHLRERGILTFYYTLNSTDEYEGALSIGAKGIITDIPSELNKFLKERHLLLKRANNGPKVDDKKQQEKGSRDNQKSINAAFRVIGQNI